MGRTVAESAALHGREPWETALRLLVEDRLGSTILQHVGHEENVRAIMRHRVHTGGSDGILQGAKPHPRAYGTFPHYLGHYVRELGVLSLEECVAHLTGRAAARLRLPDRGLVREGYQADLVLFDPDTVAATATFEAPRSLPAGIPHVLLVAGQPVIADGRRTDVLAGRAVRYGGGEGHVRTGKSEVSISIRSPVTSVSVRGPPYGTSLTLPYPVANGSVITVQSCLKGSAIR